MEHNTNAMIDWDAAINAAHECLYQQKGEIYAKAWCLAVTYEEMAEAAYEVEQPEQLPQSCIDRSKWSHHEEDTEQEIMQTAAIFYIEDQAGLICANRELEKARKSNDEMEIKDAKKLVEKCTIN